MRLLVTLQKKSKEQPKIEREYIRNLIYFTLRNSIWAFYHDKKIYKHFCYSNIFPLNYTAETVSSFRFIISSPYKELISYLEKAFLQNKELHFGNVYYPLIEIKKYYPPHLIEHLITATPIVLRIHDEQIEKGYFFYTSQEGFRTFVDSLTQNAILRYKDYLYESQILRMQTNVEKFKVGGNIFSGFKFLKNVYGWDKHFSGVMMELHINQFYVGSSFIEYIYEAGLGERNAGSGSGFVNLLN